MDCGGSFLDLACIRIAVVPASPMTDARFAELCEHIQSFDELPVNALPRAQSSPRRPVISSNTMAAGPDKAATFSHAPAELRALQQQIQAGGSLLAPPSTYGSPALTNSFFARSRSMNRNEAPRRTHSLSPPRGIREAATAEDAAPASSKDISSTKHTNDTSHTDIAAEAPSEKPPGQADASGQRVASTFERFTQAAFGSSTTGKRWAESAGTDGDANVRIKYEIVHRNGSNGLALSASSEWDSFFSQRTWGVLGVVDCVDESTGADARDETIAAARTEFLSALSHFKGAAVTRLVVFTSPSAAEGGAAFVDDLEETRGLGRPTSGTNGHGGTDADSEASTPSSAGTPLSPQAITPSAQASPGAARPVSIGYVPTKAASEVKLEVRVQIIHFLGLVMSALEVWIHRDTITKDLFLSPLDEHNAPEKLSKLAKRRPGRLDKVQGDYLLMTGAPGEAVSKYNSAIERAKATSDSLWQAGSMEGLCAAQVYGHVAAGGRVDSDEIVTSIVEQYSEIQKLYHRKRVAELEAASSLRFAEFLGQFTQRRKEALDAASQACIVAEDLRSTKRHWVWEQLARFYTRMGCRRKAALLLYRIGSTDASQDSWNKALTTLAASADQFRVHGKTSWPGLHRQVLLEAACAGRESGDSTQAARHAVEALSLSPLIHDIVGDSDGDIVQLLLSCPIPATLPNVDRLVAVDSLAAVQMENLDVRIREIEDPALDDMKKKTSRNRNDFFLYNPFEARKAAERAAEAGRTVTWVCGEPAAVSLHIANSTQTQLPVEILAVSLAEEGKEDDVWPTSDSPANRNIVPFSSTESTKSSGTLLQNMSKVSSTVSQVVVLMEQEYGGSKTVHVSVVPRKPGSVMICGVVLRLFGNAIVFAPIPASPTGTRQPPINVLPALPRLEVSFQPHGDETPSASFPRNPLSIFEGEHQRMRIWVVNSGPDDIREAHVQIRSKDPETLRIELDTASAHGARERISALRRGSAEAIDVYVRAMRKPKSSTSSSGDGWSACDRDLVVSSMIYVQVEYVGKTCDTHYRTSGATANFNVSPAIYVENLSTVAVTQGGAYEPSSALRRRKTTSDAPEGSKGSFPRLPFHEIARDSRRTGESAGIVVDVANRAATPLVVELFTPKQTEDRVHDISIPQTNLTGGYGCPSCYVECNASARLLAPLQFGLEILERERAVEADGERASKVASPLRLTRALKWRLPALGREGTVPLFDTDLSEAALAALNRSGYASWSNNSEAGDEQLHQVKLELCVKKDSNVSDSAMCTPAASVDGAAFGPRRSWSERDFGVTITTKSFYFIQAKVRNRGSAPLPESATLDIHVAQRDGRGGVRVLPTGCLIGAVDGVACGALAPGEEFEHGVLLRIGSAGQYELVGNVYTKEAVLKEAILDEPSSRTLDERIGTNPTAGEDVVPLVDSFSDTLNEKDPPSVDDTVTSASPQDELQRPLAAADPGTQAGEAGDTPRATLHRVGVSRRRRVEDSRASPNVRPGVATSGPLSPSTNAVHPLPAGTQSDELAHTRTVPPIASCSVLFVASNDTRWSAGLLGPDEGLSHEGGSITVGLDASALPEPDTMM